MRIKPLAPESNDHKYHDRAGAGRRNSTRTALMSTSNDYDYDSPIWEGHIPRGVGNGNPLALAYDRWLAGCVYCGVKAMFIYGIGDPHIGITETVCDCMNCAFTSSTLEELFTKKIIGHMEITPARKESDDEY